MFDSDDESEEAAEESSMEPHKPANTLFEESSSESCIEEPSELGPKTGAKEGLRAKVSGIAGGEPVLRWCVGPLNRLIYLAPSWAKCISSRYPKEDAE